MRRFNPRRVAVLAISVVVLLAGAAAATVGQAGRADSKKWPPQFPREGATLLFENERVIVWEQIGRPKEAFVHKHIHDILNFVIEPGGGISVLNADGSKGSGSPLTQTIYNKRPYSMTYTKSGLGPHAEVMNDANNPGRSIFVEIKGTEPSDCREWSTGCR